jgi:hypothetical protein
VIVVPALAPGDECDPPVVHWNDRCRALDTCGIRSDARRYSPATSHGTSRRGARRFPRRPTTSRRTQRATPPGQAATMELTLLRCVWLSPRIPAREPAPHGHASHSWSRNSAQPPRSDLAVFAGDCRRVSPRHDDYEACQCQVPVTPSKSFRIRSMSTRCAALRNFILARARGRVVRISLTTIRKRRNGSAAKSAA